MKICPLETEMFHDDRPRDMTKLRVPFHIFTNVPKITEK